MTQSEPLGAPVCRNASKGSNGSGRFKASLNRRFSDEEQRAFGRFSHVNIRSRLAGATMASTMPTVGIPSLLRVRSEAAILGRASDLGVSASEVGPSGALSPTGLPSISQDRSCSAGAAGNSTGGGSKRRKRASSATGERNKSCTGDPELQELLQKLLPTDRALPLPWEVDVEREQQPQQQHQSKHLSVRGSLSRPLSGSMSKQSSTASRELAATVSAGPNFCRDASLTGGGGGGATTCASSTDARSDAGCSSQTSAALSRPSRPPKPSSQRAQSPGVSPRHRVKVLDKFRWELLQRFRSLYDAFHRLHDLATRENALKRDEFCQAFEMFGIKESDSSEVFEVIDFKQLGSVSLAHLRSVLGAGTRQAVLWELRCRLLVSGITPNDMAKVRMILEVARRPRHRTVRQQRWRADGGYIVQQKATACSASTSTQDSDGEDATKEEITSGWAEAVETKSGAWRVGFRPSSTQLSRTDWLHVCAAIGLTLLEAERLFDEIGDAQTGIFDLTEMFNALRSGVAPHVSLERFATRVLTRYGSFEAAFNAIHEKPSRLVHWKEFHKLAVLLDVEDRNAARLWNVLCLAQRSLHDEDGQCSKDGADGKEADAQGLTAAVEPQDCGGIQEDIFVKELTIWAPATALDALKHQVSELFNSPGEFRYALEQAGIACGSSVSVSSLQAALQSVGIVGCDAERLLRAVASSREPTKRRGVSLEDIISVMQGTDDFHAHTAVRDDFQPVWQQALTVQAALRDPNPDAWQHWSLNRAAAPQNEASRPKYGGRSLSSFRRSASFSALSKEHPTDGQ